MLNELFTIALFVAIAHAVAIQQLSLPLPLLLVRPPPLLLACPLPLLLLGPSPLRAKGWFESVSGQKSLCSPFL